MAKPRVWVLPGMGADSRIFRAFSFPWQATYLEWIMPKEGETLSCYADRLLDRYPIQEHDILFGYSFGGIIAQDWASRNQVQRVVLLNSVHFSSPIRPLFHRIAKTGLLKWAPNGSVRNFIFFMARLNSKSKPSIDHVLEMMEQFPCSYYRWVLRAVLDWERKSPLCPVDSIRGDQDVVFPFENKNAQHDWVLKGATHLSFQTHTGEIAKLLKEGVDPLLS
jgi:pimeloyl-ACP methyl ester carboxylesterase